MSVSTPISPTALVTGADTPLGYETARLLGEAGYTLLLHTDSLTSGDLVLERLVKDGADPLRLDLVAAAFTDLHEVAELAARVIHQRRKLDLLVNANVIAPTDQRLLTHDGHERTFAVNYVAPYLLTRLLAVTLRQAHGRVVNVSSTLHAGANITWNDLNRSHRYSRLAVYGQASLATVMFTTTLATMWGDSLTVCCVDPGSTDRDVLRLHGPLEQPEPDAAGYVLQACTTDLARSNGGFFAKSAVVPATHVTARATDRLWALSARMTGLSS